MTSKVPALCALGFLVALLSPSPDMWQSTNLLVNHAWAVRVADFGTSILLHSLCCAMLCCAVLCVDLPITHACRLCEFYGRCQ